MQISFGMQNIQKTGSIFGTQQSEKMVALGINGNDLEQPTDSLDTLVDFLEKFNRYNFPVSIKRMAKDFKMAYNNLKLLQTEFNSEQKRTGNKARLKIVEKQLNSVGKKTENLFNQMKNEYMAWYNKEVPAHEKIQVGAYNYYYTAKVYTWFKSNTYDYSKGEVVSAGN